MGTVKQWLMEDAEKEREADMREWFMAKYGSQLRKELARAFDDYEPDEAMAHTFNKDD